MYFKIEINILDYYSFECEKVRVLVFINYSTDTQFSRKYLKKRDHLEDTGVDDRIITMVFK